MINIETNFIDELLGDLEKANELITIFVIL